MESYSNLSSSTTSSTSSGVKAWKSGSLKKRIGFWKRWKESWFSLAEGVLREHTMKSGKVH